jgi:hypothetical protein
MEWKVVKELAINFVVGPAAGAIIAWAVGRGWKIVYSGGRRFLRPPRPGRPDIEIGICFVAGTPVLVPPDDPEFSLGEAGNSVPESSSTRDWLFAGAALVLGVAGWEWLPRPKGSLSRTGATGF